MNFYVYQYYLFFKNLFIYYSFIYLFIYLFIFTYLFIFIYILITYDWVIRLFIYLFTFESFKLEV